MLPWPRYRRAFEPGCSIGVLTAQLARPLRQPAELRRVGGRGRTARERTAQFPQVTVEQRLVPADWPAAASST